MMTIWGILLVTLVFTYLSERYIQKNKRELNHYKKADPFFISSIIVLTVYSGLRSSIGDTGYYMYTFNHLTTNISDIFKERDWGFVFYQMIIKTVFSHPQPFVLITSAFTIIPIFLTIKKYSPDVLFSVFLFFVGGAYVSSMNGIRQFLVASILFYASSLIFQGKKYRFFILVLITSTIHSSALIMIPIYYVVRRESWTRRTFLSMFAVVFLFFGFNNFSQILTPLLATTQYSSYVGNILYDSNNGANLLRAVVSFIPVFLSYIYYKELKTKLVNYNVYINFSLLNFIISLFATYNWIFARLNMYLSLYNLILLPAIIYYCFNKKDRLLVKYIAFCLYLIYFYFDLQPHIYASYYLDINTELIGPLTRTFYN